MSLMFNQFIFIIFRVQRVNAYPSCQVVFRAEWIPIIFNLYTLYMYFLQTCTMCMNIRNILRTQTCVRYKYCLYICSQRALSSRKSFCRISAFKCWSKTFFYLFCIKIKTV